MDILANKSKGKVLKNDGLAIGAEAKSAKQKDPNVINATIGTLYNESNEFYKFDSVDKIVKNLKDEEFYSYSSTTGSVSFQDAILDWVFDDSLSDIKESMNIKSIPTPGGTGAVSNSLYNALDNGETLLLPDIYWKPYFDMASSNCYEVMEYPLIINDKFNLDGFIKYSDEIIKKQGKVVTILNDPCNNPTGYSLTLDEFTNLIDYMNSRSDALFNVILDIAYFDYSLNGRHESREKLKLLKNANKNIIFNIAFSCSKSFSIYGLRLGAQIILSKSKEMVDELYASTTYLARSRWSNVSKAGISLLTKLYQNKELKDEFISELEIASKLVNERAKLFIDCAKENNLDIYPYYGGFFITIKFNNSELLMNELKIKGAYVLPVSKGIRVAICSINKKEIIRIVKLIKYTINDII